MLSASIVRIGLNAFFCACELVHACNVLHCARAIICRTQDILHWKCLQATDTFAENGLSNYHSDEMRDRTIGKLGIGKMP